MKSDYILFNRIIMHSAQIVAKCRFLSTREILRISVSSVVSINANSRMEVPANIRGHVQTSYKVISVAIRISKIANIRISDIVWI